MNNSAPVDTLNILKRRRLDKELAGGIVYAIGGKQRILKSQVGGKISDRIIRGVVRDGQRGQKSDPLQGQLLQNLNSDRRANTRLLLLRACGQGQQQNR